MLTKMWSEKLWPTRRVIRRVGASRSASCFAAPQQTCPLPYFVLATAEGLPGWVVVLTGACSFALRTRFLSRFLACIRLRMFSRALCFGIVGLHLEYLGSSLMFHLYILRCCSVCRVAAACSSLLSGTHGARDIRYCT